MIKVDCRVPRGSVANRPTVAAFIRSFEPAELPARATCPCPVTAIAGIQKLFGLDVDESNHVPD